MTWKLTIDEIVKHWELIKYGAVMVQRPVKQELYSLGLLKNLLLGKYQCWFIINERREIKMMAITHIFTNEGDRGHLIIEPIFGFIHTTEDEQRELIETIIKFSKTLKLESVIGFPSNPRVVYIAERVGMKKVNEIFELKIGEE